MTGYTFGHQQSCSCATRCRCGGPGGCACRRDCRCGGQQRAGPIGPALARPYDLWAEAVDHREAGQHELLQEFRRGGLGRGGFGRAGGWGAGRNWPQPWRRRPGASGRAAGPFRRQRVMSARQQAQARRLAAIRGRNRFFAGRLGWARHVRRITRLIGCPVCPPGSMAFIGAIARWQLAAGLPATGVLGPGDWEAMRQQLGGGRAAQQGGPPQDPSPPQDAGQPPPNDPSAPGTEPTAADNAAGPPDGGAGGAIPHEPDAGQDPGGGGGEPPTGGTEGELVLGFRGRRQVWGLRPVPRPRPPRGPQQQLLPPRTFPGVYPAAAFRSPAFGTVPYYPKDLRR